eukprot:GEMP01058586.1.p1 GENE.GEMP01058586.1~~GEMP01058586.1.p1  ORF type:complete len:416 (+),score=75.02 GEMP01058586.1:187-1434(+)
MIRYANRGVALLFTMMQMEGSVFPRSAAVASFASLCSFLLLGYKQGWLVGDDDPAEKWLDHPFAAQAFSTLLGLCVVFRTTMALGRYEEGISRVQQMTSRWADAFQLVSSFTNASITAGGNEEILNKWQRQMAHWFSLMSAFATCELRRNLFQPGFEEDAYSMMRHRDLVLTEYPRSFKKLSAKNDDNVNEACKEEESTRKEPYASKRRSIYSSICFSQPLHEQQGQITAGIWSLFWHSHYWPQHSRTVAHDDSVEFLIPTSEEERAALDNCTDKVLILSYWIQESITRILNEEVLRVPPPIATRLYQELSDGILGFNQALKISLVPFPFPFAQMLTLLMLTFVITSPIIIITAVFGFWGLNEIAVELENPFGDDLNDLPLVAIHSELIYAIEASFMKPPDRYSHLEFVDEKLLF